MKKETVDYHVSYRDQTGAGHCTVEAPDPVTADNFDTFWESVAEANGYDNKEDIVIVSMTRLG